MWFFRMLESINSGYDESFEASKSSLALGLVIKSQFFKGLKVPKNHLWLLFFLIGCGQYVCKSFPIML